MTPIDTSGRRASYAGRTLTLAFRGSHHFGLGDDGGEFPDAIERGTNSTVGAWVKVPRGAVDRVWEHYVGATWDGQPVQVLAVDGDRVTVSHGRDQAWAEAHGLRGSHRDGGWTGHAPRQELQDVYIEDVEKPS